MQKPLIRVISAAIFLLFMVSFSSAPARDMITIDQVLARLEKKYAQKSFEAFFSQTTTIAAFDLEDAASGKVWFSHPGKMRWQYLSPRQYELITNGKTVWIYQPQEKQVRVGDAQQAFSDGGGGTFLSDFSLLKTNYESSIEAVTDSEILIRLVPRQPTPAIASIQIRMLRKDDTILQVTTWNQQDDSTRFEFRDIHFSDSHPAMFEFTPPADVTIIKEE